LSSISLTFDICFSENTYNTFKIISGEDKGDLCASISVFLGEKSIHKKRTT